MVRSLCLACAGGAWASIALAQATDSSRVFMEAWHVAGNAFYDPAMHGVDWEGVRDELLTKAAGAADGAALSGVINEALGRLHASHTAHYSPDRREYYELLDVFWPDGVPERKGSAIAPGPVLYVGVGMATKRIEGRTFAVDVYEAGPAAEAGILAGDELVAVEDGPWSDVAAFRGRDGLPTRVVLRRAEGEEPREVVVRPGVIRPRQLFLDSMRAGARVVGRGGKSIGYVRVRSYAHRSYHDLLKELLAGELKEADALVLDLRGGWGGANPEYLDIFNPAVPRLLFRNRDGSERTFDAAWEKPAAVLIDGGTRSGKEVLAYAIRKHGLATLVGERTAGAVLAGTVRPLSDGSVLYIAVSDLTVDGERLEGVGVEPHVAVDRALPFSAGRDPPLEAALDLLGG